MGVNNLAKKVFKFAVDTVSNNSLSVASVKQLDNAVFEITVTTEGRAMDLTGHSAILFIRKPDEKLVMQETGIVITNATAGKLKIDVRNTAFQSVGIAVAELELRAEDGDISTINFSFDVYGKIGSNEAIKSEVDVNLFKELGDYIHTALTEIKEYKALFEAFTQAGVSLQGLLDIKEYIDVSLSDLKTQIEKAVQQTTTLDSTITRAEEVGKELQNIINGTDGGVALKPDLDKKLDKTGGTVTGDLTVDGKINVGAIEGLSSTDVKGAIQELFQSANNGKKQIAETVGTPLLASDTFPDMKGKIQGLKDSMAEKLTAKEQPSTGTENLQDLINKVENIKVGYQSGEVIPVDKVTLELDETLSSLAVKSNSLTLFSETRNRKTVAVPNTPLTFLTVSYDSIKCHTDKEVIWAVTLSGGGDCSSIVTTETGFAYVMVNGLYFYDYQGNLLWYKGMTGIMEVDYSDKNNYLYTMVNNTFFIKDLNGETVKQVTSPLTTTGIFAIKDSTLFLACNNTVMKCTLDVKAVWSSGNFTQSAYGWLFPLSENEVLYWSSSTSKAYKFGQGFFGELTGRNLTYKPKLIEGEIYSFYDKRVGTSPLGMYLQKHSSQNYMPLWEAPLLTKYNTLDVCGDGHGNICCVEEGCTIFQKVGAVKSITIK